MSHCSCRWFSKRMAKASYANICHAPVSCGEPCSPQEAETDLGGRGDLCKQGHVCQGRPLAILGVREVVMRPHQLGSERNLHTQ